MIFVNSYFLVYCLPFTVYRLYVNLNPNPNVNDNPNLNVNHLEVSSERSEFNL